MTITRIEGREDRRAARQLRAMLDARLKIGSKSQELVPEIKWAELVRDVPGLTFGYIGTVSQSHDNRLHYIRTEKEVGGDAFGNPKLNIWTGGKLTRAEFATARKMVNAYRAGTEITHTLKGETR